MKLIDWLPDASGPQTDLYRTVKRFFLEVELTGLVSLTLLQAALLIAFYELGHAIYPFANISVGVCVRYGAALGIEPRSQEQGNRLSTDWIEEEERTRLWWALFLLDRLVLFHCSVLSSGHGGSDSGTFCKALQPSFIPENLPASRSPDLSTFCRLMTAYGIAG
jgi:hypothetical protein